MIYQIQALAINTFREAVRDKVLHSIFFFATVGIVFSVGLKEITIGDQAKIIRSIGQGGIDIFSAVIAMFLGISLLYKEIEKKTIYTILSKPIPRWIFVLGKYCGLMLTVLSEVILLALVYVIVISVQQGFPESSFFISLILLFVELMLLTAWATLYSAYSSPTVATAFILSTFVIGHLADDIWIFGNQSENPMLQQSARYLYWMLPNFEALSIREIAVHQESIPWNRFWGAIGYGLSYTCAVLLLAIKVFERKDIK
jgi:Cu-processing system permease protein